MKPVIGIPECYKFENYKYAVKEHDGRVEKLYIGDEVDMTKLDGLLLPGGGDIAPERYHEPRHPKTKYVNEERDEFEISLFNEAIEKDIPVFGICRGIQIMNVALGGSLYQDIDDKYPRPACKHDGKPDDDWHEIEIESGSKLMDIVEESTDKVNSAHHQAIKEIGKSLVNTAHKQAIDDIGEGLVVTARSEDGIIEAIEAKPFVIGLQYHPERMWIDKTLPLCQREFLEHATKLFEAFINAATERREKC